MPAERSALQQALRSGAHLITCASSAWSQIDALAQKHPNAVLHRRAIRLALSLFRWWYLDGFRVSAQKSLERLKNTYDFFSIGQLLARGTLISVILVLTLLPALLLICDRFVLKTVNHDAENGGKEDQEDRG